MRWLQLLLAIDLLLCALMPTELPSMADMQMYTVYSILCIVFLLLVVVTAFVTVALTYFQLAIEDHRWWWQAFLNGGSTSMLPWSIIPVQD